MRGAGLPDDLDVDRTGYDPTTDTYHDRHDWDRPQPLMCSIAEAIAAVTDDVPTAIDPLYEAVDPYAVEQLLRSFRASEHEPGGAVRFTFNDRTVDVRSDGEICVHCEPSGSPPR